MKIVKLEHYSEETASRIRELLIQLSRSGKDRGEIPREWFEDLINSDDYSIKIFRTFIEACIKYKEKKA